MTLTRTATIPSEFIRFDSYVTDADSFNNVRDAQVARENLNILLARRIRHPILAVRGLAGSYSSLGAYAAGFGAIGTGAYQPGATWLGPWRIWIPPYCKALTVRMRAHPDPDAGDAIVYPCFGTTGPNAGYMLTVTGASDAEYEIDIPTPTSYSGGPYFTDFRLYITSESTGADVSSAAFVVVP